MFLADSELHHVVQHVNEVLQHIAVRARHTIGVQQDISVKSQRGGRREEGGGERGEERRGEERTGEGGGKDIGLEIEAGRWSCTLCA